MPVYVIDIDGTVADNSHREPFIKAPKKDWKRFYDPELMMLDRPIEKAQLALPKLTKDSILFFLTGRPERTRQTTMQWMSQYFPSLAILNRSENDSLYFVKGYIQLLMRDDVDHRKAVAYKEGWAKAISTIGETVFLDDDLRNAEMYRRYGTFYKAPECWDIYTTP